MRFYITLILFFGSLNLKAQNQTAIEPSADSISYAGFPVTVYNQTLFYIKNSLGPLSAKDRSNIATEKITSLAKDFLTKTDSIRFDTSGANANIIYHDVIIMSVTPEDAKYNHLSTKQLAENYKNAIVRIIQKYQTENNIVEISKRVGFGLLILLVLALLIFYLNRYFNRLKEWLAEKIDPKISNVKIKSYELLSKDKALFFLRRSINIIKYFIIVLSIYIALPLIFRLFPWTKNWSGALINFILQPIKNIIGGIIAFIPNLIAIIVIVMVFRYLLKGIKFLASEIETSKLKLSGFYPEWAKPTYNLIKFILYAFMLVVIWPLLPGSDTQVFKGVSVFLGVLLSFGSSSTIGNMIAGLVITYMRPFKLKDRVKIGEVVGDVIEKSLLVTRIKTPKNEIITIPNGAVLAGNTVNYSSIAKKEGCILHTTITIGYDAPWRQIHELLISAAESTEGISNKTKPFVLQTSLDDWYVSYQINAYTHQPEKSSKIYSNLHQNIQDKFNEAGVEIMSPHYQSLRDGNQTTVPSDYLPKDYQSPSFNINKKD